MNKKTIVYFFHAPWCSSCPAMEHTVKQVQKELDSQTLDFQYVDVENESGVDLTVKYQVRNVPTVLLVKSNRVIERITGTRTKEQIKEVLNKWK